MHIDLANPLSLALEGSARCLQEFITLFIKIQRKIKFQNCTCTQHPCEARCHPTPVMPGVTQHP